MDARLLCKAGTDPACLHLMRRILSVGARRDEARCCGARHSPRLLSPGSAHMPRDAALDSGNGWSMV